MALTTWNGEPRYGPMIATRLQTVDMFLSNIHTLAGTRATRGREAFTLVLVEVFTSSI